MAELIIENSFRSMEAKFDIPREQFGFEGLCVEAADVVVEAAAAAGIRATTELHIGHMVTTFSEPTSPPTPVDQILCLTWGQFLPVSERERRLSEGIEPYFGERQGIKRLLGASAVRQTFHYALAYSPNSLIARTQEIDNGEHSVLYFGKHYAAKRLATIAFGKVVSKFKL